jgi:hypothetical protein
VPSDDLNIQATPIGLGLWAIWFPRGEGHAAHVCDSQYRRVGPHKEKNLKRPPSKPQISKTGTPDIPDEELLAELARVAMAPASSGRHALAKTTALRTLANLNARRGPALTESEKRLWAEDRDEDERVTDADWHPDPGTKWAELDACHTVAHRRRWWLNLSRARR